MNITSVEVIRPGVDAIEVVAGERIELTYGDILKVNVSFDYRGLARETILEGAIGKLHGFPTEWLEVLLKSGTTIDIPESLEFTLYERSVEIPITSDIGPGTDYDLSVSLRDYREAGHPTEVDVIDIVGIPPEYELIQETIHPASYVYEGEEEVCIIEFPLTPEQIPFTQWGGLKLADIFASTVEAEGNSLLEVRVWEDTTPLFWTNYCVEIKAAVASEEQGVAWGWLAGIGAVLVSLPWKAIITGALGVLGIWIVGWVIEKLIKAVDRVIHRPPALTDEIIEGLGREDLIPMILYKAPRVEPPYEVTEEELETMTDDGLRALLKDLRDRQAREELEWWPLIIVGGVAVLGVGAAAIALTARRE